MKKNSYLTTLDEVLPRILGLIDRDIDSETYGCCDRNFWMYKITDFSSGIIQQCSLTFSLLYYNSNDFDYDCNFLKNEQKKYYKDIAIAVNHWTLKLVNNGALDEYYHNERSFPATVFSGYALLKSSLILNDKFVLKSDKLYDIANFLCNRKPSLAANQDAAAAAYLWLFYNNINKSEKYLKQVRNLLNRKEFNGGFDEYYGFDFGYATVSVNYLAYMLNDGYLEAGLYIEKIYSAICYAATASPIVSGNIFSRNTSYYLPYAIDKIIELYPEESQNLKYLSFLSVMNKLDDRYMMHYFTPSLAFSAFNNVDYSVCSSANKSADIVELLNYGGVIFITYKRISFIVSLIKKGVFSISYNKKHYCNNGYRLIDDGVVYNSDNIIPNFGKDSLISRDNDVITITIFGVFSRYLNLSPSPMKSVILRIMSVFGPFLNLLFKKILITTPKVLDGSNFVRKIIIDLKKSSIKVEDSFNISKNSKLYMSPNFSSRLVPSAKFYQESDLSQNIKKTNIQSDCIRTNISLLNDDISTIYKF